MPGKLGKALEGAVKKENAKRPSIPIIGVDVLKVLEAVFSRPGLSINGIALLSRYSWDRARKTVERALERGYILEIMGCSSAGFVPVQRVSEQYRPTLVAVADGRTGSLLEVVISHPGIGLEEALRSAHGAGKSRLSTLEHVGLVSMVKDGKFKRLYPAETYRSVNSDLEQWESSLSRDVMARLSNDGYDPTLETTPRGSAYVRVGEEPFRLPISINIPYATTF
ncbi:MAG: hypothetical protein KAT70_02785 [Thermoplasmata archaeon]|nr:hypothetical protein [Thermoplasmata archaeon]